MYIGTVGKKYNQMEIMCRTCKTMPNTAERRRKKK